MNKAPNLRKHRYSQIEHIYSVTFCTVNRKPFFLDFRLARTIVNEMKHQDAMKRTETLAFVVMPDHVHWLFKLKNTSLGEVMRNVKSCTAHQFGQPLWQKGYYEHQVRKEQCLVKLSRYIVANPLRAKLVDTIANYPFWDAVWMEGYM